LDIAASPKESAAAAEALAPTDDEADPKASRAPRAALRALADHTADEP
jgi:hypothetical protein